MRGFHLFAPLCLAALARAASRKEAGAFEFEEIGVAQGAEKFQMRGPSKFSLVADTDSVSAPTEYHLLARSGIPSTRPQFTNAAPSASNSVPSAYYLGMILDQNGKGVKPLVLNGSAIDANATGFDVSTYPDFTSILNPFQNGTLRSIVHFENPNPGSMALLRLLQNPGTGALAVESFSPVDWSSLGGLWNPCAGSVSPWQTHLGSEEYEPDARVIEEAQAPLDLFKAWNIETAPLILHFIRYFGLYPETATMEQVREAFKPYRYGFVTEVSLGPDGEVAKIQKHYAMGRVSVELPTVAPDNQTVFISDDGTNRGFYMFKADRPSDLSSGTLYAIKVKQRLGFGGGEFSVDWVDLGHAAESDIEPHLANTTFSDIWAVAPPLNVSGVLSCPPGFKSTNTAQGFAGSIECLALKPGQAQLASRLETRRYAAYLGATTEFTKLEGTALSVNRRTLYLSVSQVRDGMENNNSKGKALKQFDVGGSNDVQVEYNICGCESGFASGGVVQLSLNETWVPFEMEPLVCGKMNQTNVDANNTCDVDGIAEPDNLAIMPEYDSLIIGEDTTTGHQNDMVWLYDLQTGKMTRFLTVPYGAESTSLYWYSNINGFSYIVAVGQHPYVESDMAKENLAGSEGPAAYIGYVGPFPAKAALEQKVQASSA